MDPFDNFDKAPGVDKKWISAESLLKDINGQNKNIKIELMDDGMPRAMAFFDIDGTLAHLGSIHGKAIRKLFPDQDGEELEETYYRGFKLGNSFREFDRMRGIYVDSHTEWKDPEIYLKERFNSHVKEIDEPGNSAHDIAGAILEEYGKVAGEVADELYKTNPKEFEKSNIAPIFLLARMYSRLGIPMVGFTANARVFIEKLAKYLKLSDLFLDIATDETMTGGGKEIAIHKLISQLESMGIPVPKNRLIFVGDSLRGDIATGLTARDGDKQISGQGVLVLKDREALIQIKRQISEDPQLRALADSININGLIVSDVPLDQDGKPMLLSRFRDKFLERL